MIKEKRYQVTADWPGTSKFLLLLFDYTHEAAYFVNYMIGDEKIKWISDTKIMTGEGIQLKSDDLEALIEYEPTGKEIGYMPSNPHRRWYEEFKGKHRLTGSPPRGVEVVNRSPSGATEASKAPNRPKKVPGVPRPSKEGLVTISQIAERLGMIPRIARGILRDTDTPKPEVGWAWKEGPEVEAIIKILKANTP